MKYYFFRDLENGDNLYNGTTYHSAGVVRELNTQVGTPLNSGKDVLVTYLNPFMCEVVHQYRAFSEIELFETSDYEWEMALKYYDVIEQSLKNYDEIRKGLQV